MLSRRGLGMLSKRGFGMPSKSGRGSVMVKASGFKFHLLFNHTDAMLMPSESWNSGALEDFFTACSPSPYEGIHVAKRSCWLLFISARLPDFGLMAKPCPALADRLPPLSSLVVSSVSAFWRRLMGLSASSLSLLASPFSRGKLLDKLLAFLW